MTVYSTRYYRPSILTSKLQHCMSFWSFFLNSPTYWINDQGVVGIQSLLPPNCKCTLSVDIWRNNLQYFIRSPQWGILLCHCFIQLPSSDCWLHSSWSCWWWCLSWSYCLVFHRAEADCGSVSSVVHKLVIDCYCILCDVHYSFRLVREGLNFRLCNLVPKYFCK